MEPKVNEEWTAEVVGRMHRYRISNAELAQECGFSGAYLSTVLNGRKEFSSAESKEKTKDTILRALDRMIAKIEGGMSDGFC